MNVRLILFEYIILKNSPAVILERAQRCLEKRMRCFEPGFCLISLLLHWFRRSFIKRQWGLHIAVREDGLVCWRARVTCVHTVFIFSVKMLTCFTLQVKYVYKVRTHFMFPKSKWSWRAATADARRWHHALLLTNAGDVPSTEPRDPAASRRVNLDGFCFDRWWKPEHFRFCKWNPKPRSSGGVNVIIRKVLLLM